MPFSGKWDDMGEQRRRKETDLPPLRLLLERPAAGSLFLALVILTLTGVGNVIVVGLVGLLLCAAGSLQKSAKADLWIFLALLAYNIISMISSWAVYGNIILSYGSTQIIWPLLYLLAGTLEGREQALLRRLCALWVGAVALHGIGEFAYLSLTTGARRLSGIMGNPNAMGVFLVIGWFAAVSAAEEESEKSRISLRYLEPLILLALSLTLSMGSFLSLAVGMAVLILRREKTWPERFRFACRTLAKASLVMGTGMLTYLSAGRTDYPWFSLVTLAYGGAVICCWPAFCRFLEEHGNIAALASGAGVLVAGAAVAVRPSSLATFAERLAMMRNGMGYLTRSPLLGVGPYQWRLLNLYDDDKYFNTYHIHNVLIHVGVELGLIAMAALIVIAVRFWRKQSTPERQGGFAAFCFHCMMDTGFFYLGITGLTMLALGDPRQGGRTVGTGTLRVLLAAFAALFLYNIAVMLGGGATL